MEGKMDARAYIINYIHEKKLSPAEAARAAGIAEAKLSEGCTEPLYADEFLGLCASLSICPEQVAEAIRRQ